MNIVRWPFKAIGVSFVDGLGRPSHLGCFLMSLRIYLIRHGETEWSVSGQHTGLTDIPLTSNGETAARCLGLRLQHLSFAHVVSSPLIRARRTCELASLHGTVEIEPSLVEWDYGDFEGKTTDEIRRLRPDWNLFRDGSPGGETPQQVSDRADRLVTWIRALDGNVALFSHGHFGRVLGAKWIGLSIAQSQHLTLDTASLSVLGYEHDRIEEPVIALWNSRTTGKYGEEQ